MIKVALIGLPLSGKTTIFNALTSLKAKGRNIGVVKILDERLDCLHRLYPEKKRVSSEMEFIDTHSIKTETKILDLANIDAIAIVITCFGEPIEPIKEIKTILQEFILSDLLIAEKRIANLASKGRKMTQEEEKEKAIIERCRDSLSKEIPLRKIGLTDDERRHLSSYQFLSDKPIVLIGNIDEQRKDEELKEYARENNEQCVILSGKLEMEVAELEENERASFLKELGIKESGLSLVIKTIYTSLSLISFFTIGKDEVRLWPIKKGTNALKAAGKIHSDMERGFIRASVVSYKDFLENKGSMAHLKEKGLIRLEGKDYIVADGDIIEFRFNV
ncbi:MAG: DUF933 domain-containing protein [bacterium]